MSIKTDDALTPDKNVSKQLSYQKARQIKNLISLMLLRNPEGITLKQLSVFLSPLNVKPDRLLQWLNGKGRLGKFLGGSFMLEKAEPKEATRIRFPENKKVWLAILLRCSEPLEFRIYENKILNALFNPERAGKERDEFLLLHSGRYFSFMRDGKDLFVFYPLPKEAVAEVVEINFERVGAGKMKAKLSFDLTESFVHIDIGVIEELTGLRDSLWRFEDIFLVHCDKRILQRIEESGGLLVSELKKTGE